MGKANLIIADVLFVIALVAIYITGDLKTNAIILFPLIIIGFATCVVRHINHYKHTNRIY
jgi:phage-related holin